MKRAVAPGCGLELLDSKHDRSAFACGVESLDCYLQTQASQDIRRRATAVYVIVRDDAPTRILGYGTLSAFSLELTAIPETERKYLPRYPLVSATLIGRLAIDRSEQSKGLGSLLLGSILRVAYDSALTVGSSMIAVDAIDERAAPQP
jgi:GNAT superfamily N-acetyltransferase